jgi:PhoH-like ATPase
MSKKFVIDTNVFILDPNAIDNFDGNMVIIPSVVLSELNELKESRYKHYGVRLAAQETNKKLELYIDKEPEYDSDETYTPFGENGKLKFSIAKVDGEIFDIYPDNKNDNHILQIAKDEDAILVSNDINLRLKAKAIGIKAESYKSIEVDTSGLDFINELTDTDFEEIGLNMKNYNDNVDFLGAKRNHYYIKNNHIFKGIKDNVLEPIHNKNFTINKKNNIKPIEPQNVEQKIALDALLDDTIKVVNLIGPAGTGKTLLSLAVGLSKILDSGWNKKDNLYNSITVIKSPIHLLGKDRTGFLPGDEIDKISTFLKGIISSLAFLVKGSHDNLRYLSNQIDKTINYKTDEGILKLFLFNDIIRVINSDTIKGTTLHNQFVIIEEAEDLTFKEIKMIMTRIGENCKVVCIGDNDQISTPYQDAKSSGLSIVSHAYKDSNFSTNLYLKDVERSEVAEWATRMESIVYK